jgi:hypothetical protein
MEITRRGSKGFQIAGQRQSRMALSCLAGERRLMKIMGQRCSTAAAAEEPGEKHTEKYSDRPPMAQRSLSRELERKSEENVRHPAQVGSILASMHRSWNVVLFTKSSRNEHGRKLT